MRLVKFLSQAGVASRRHAKTMIQKGHVQINDERIRVPWAEIDEKSDKIVVQGREVRLPKKFCYYLLNKPLGYICSNRRIGKQKLAIDLVPTGSDHLFTIGRLDKDTSGLLLITNDGDFAYQVSHPSNGIQKEYLVKTYEEIMPNHLALLLKGTVVAGDFVKPKRVKKMRHGTVKITVGEGKKHEIRKLVSDAGLTLMSLARIRIGSIHLGKIAPGFCRPLTESERKELTGKVSFDGSDEIV